MGPAGCTRCPARCLRERQGLSTPHTCLISRRTADASPTSSAHDFLRRGRIRGRRTMHRSTASSRMPSQTDAVCWTSLYPIRRSIPPPVIEIGVLLDASPLCEHEKLRRPGERSQRQGCSLHFPQTAAERRGGSCRDRPCRCSPHSTAYRLAFTHTHIRKKSTPQSESKTHNITHTIRCVDIK